MSEVFHLRSWIYWWGVLTASLFVQEWLKQIANFFKDPSIFGRDKLPFSTVPGLNAWIDDIATRIPASVQFNPTSEIITAGPVRVQGWMLATFFGFLLFIVAVRFYVRALRSPLLFDDFVALFMIYLILRIEGHIVAIAKLPIQGWFSALVNNPTTAFLVILGLTLFLVFFGEGFRSRRAFWRAILEITVVALFMFPGDTAAAISWTFESLAAFGAYLKNPNNAMFAIAWGVVGMYLALQRLMAQDMPVGGGIGGGGAPRPGGSPRPGLRFIR